MSGKGEEGAVHLCNHPDDVEDPLSEPFRTLFPKEYCRLGGQDWEEPLTLLETWGKGVCVACEDGAGVLDPVLAAIGLGLELGLALGLGLGRGEEVEGTPAAGLLALSLAESLSDRTVLLLGPS